MPRPLLPAILGALLLGAAIFGSTQQAEVKKLRASLAELDGERADLRKEVDALKKLNGELAGRLDRGAPALANEAPPDETRPVRGNVVAAASGNIRGRFDNARMTALLNSPEVQQLMARQQKAGLDGRYAALFRKLNLAPAELEKFKQFLVEKQSAVGDVMAAARSQGLTGRDSRDEIRQLVQSTQEEIDANLRATLGESVYAEYKNFEATLPQRGVANQLEQRLSYTSAPLTPTQVDQLVQILHATVPAQVDRNAATDFLALSGGGRLGGTRITDAALAQAQGVLSAPQLAALQSLQEEQQAAAKLAQQLRANRPDRVPDSKEAPPRG
jgi:hypothetical protein